MSRGGGASELLARSADGWRDCLSVLQHRVDGFSLAQLGVDLGDGGGAVAEDDAGGFDADPPSPGFGGWDSLRTEVAVLWWGWHCVQRQAGAASVGRRLAP